MRLLLRGGRIIDPSQHIDEKMDLLIENGKIVKVAKNIYKEKTAAEGTASSTLKILDLRYAYPSPGTGI